MDKKKKIYIGNSVSESLEKEIEGEIIELDGVDFFKISNYDEMHRGTGDV